MKKLIPLFFIAFLFSDLQICKAQGPAITVTKFRDSAEASAWCQYDSTLVAYNVLRPTGYWDIYTGHVGPGNTLLNETCFSCLNASLPGKNYAQPCFSPNGKYMLFTAEKAVHAGTSANSIPGIGMYNDLYVMKMDGSKAWRLTTLPSSGNTNSAIIEPYFSPDGKEIQWDEMTDSVNIGVLKQYFGYWVIKIAPFIDDTVNGPYLDSNHIRTITPGGIQAFNESYGWSPDGSKILFASCWNQFWPLDDQIYTIDTLGDSSSIKQMTSTAHGYPYTEHAFYSTDGKKIVWMTNLDDDNVHNTGGGGDDWFIMNSDTTDQVRLTYFNDSLSPYWTGTIHVNGHGSYSPDGIKFLGDVGGSEPVQIDPAESIGSIYIISGNYLASVPEISQSELQCNLYPNPNTGQFTIAISQAELVSASQTTIDVYNVLGEKVYSSSLPQTSRSQFGTGSKGALNIDLGMVPSGVYFLKIFNATSSVNKKFVVEK